jgi:hypothetical protein
MLNIGTRSFGTAISAVTKTIVTGLILLCGLQSAARADIYTYTGFDFTFASGTYTLTDYVSGSFTLASPLGDNLSLASVTPSSYSFTDQVQTITSLSPPSDVTFKISTDASGNIDKWFINLENPSPYNQISTQTQPNQEDIGQSGGSEGYNLFESYSESQWTVSGTSTPEPGFYGLMAIGVGVLFTVVIRRNRREV